MVVTRLVTFACYLLYSLPAPLYCCVHPMWRLRNVLTVKPIILLLLGFTLLILLTDCCCSIEQISWLSRGLYRWTDWKFERASIFEIKPCVVALYLYIQSGFAVQIILWLRPAAKIYPGKISNDQW